MGVPHYILKVIKGVVMEAKDIEVGNFLVGKVNSSVVLRVLSLEEDGVLVKMLSSAIEPYAVGSDFLVKNKHTNSYKVLGFSSDDLKTEYVKGKTDGYGEGYQHGFTLAKEKITELDEEERQRIWQEGYDSGYNQWVDSYGFTVPNRAVKDLEDINHKKGYEEGYAQAYSELHAPTSERERQLQEKAWEEGYKEGEADMLETVNKLSAQQAADYNNKHDNEWKTARCPDEGSEGFLKDYNIEAIREDKKHKYPHYFKSVSHLEWIDVYQVNKLFPVKDDTDCILHARKKLLVCGGRGGGKDMLKDIKEAYDTLHRYLEIEGHLDD